MSSSRNGRSNKKGARVFVALPSLSSVSTLSPNASGPNAVLYAYPAGGKPSKTLPGNYALPIGSLII
jgi:hypothetical protein